MIRLHSCFFSLPRIGITGRAEDFPLLEAQEWNEIYRLSINQAVSGIILDAVDVLPTEKRRVRSALRQSVSERKRDCARQ